MSVELGAIRDCGVLTKWNGYMISLGLMNIVYYMLDLKNNKKNYIVQSAIWLRIEWFDLKLDNLYAILGVCQVDEYV